MAAPAVTGAVALYKASRPNATPAEVKEALQYLGNLDWKTSTDPDSTTRSCSTCRSSGRSGLRACDTARARAVRSRRRHVAIAGRARPQRDVLRARPAPVTSLPRGWTATLVATSLLGWTANTATSP